MARIARKKPAPRKAAKRPAAKRAAKAPVAKPSARRAGKQLTTEHRVAVASVAVHVRYGRDRVEEFELRGTAAVNVGVPEDTVRTTGVVRLSSRSVARAGTLAFNPALLNRNLVLTLAVDDADLALLREVFVTGTGSELSDPALTVWATTASPLAPDAASDAVVLEFGYSLDFDPVPAMGQR